MSNSADMAEEDRPLSWFLSYACHEQLSQQLQLCNLHHKLCRFEAMQKRVACPYLDRDGASLPVQSAGPGTV